MKADECKKLLKLRLGFMKAFYSGKHPTVGNGHIHQMEALEMAIKVIEVFEYSLHEEGAFIVEYKDDKLKLNIGGKEYEI